MRKLFHELEKLIRKGTPSVLCRITASHGSCPRGEGAMMLVTGEGRVAGTVGGGAVEYYAERTALEVIRTKETRIRRYELKKNDIEDIGMICGGDVEMTFHYLDPSLPETLGIYEELKEEVKKLATVYIFGGGHVAQALVPVLTGLDFYCVVIEDREEFADPALFGNQAETVLCDNNTHIGDYVEITPEDYVCIMTRGHKDDMIIEEQVVRTGAKYIGVIGSIHKKAGVNEQLRACGCTEEQLARMKTPIGMLIHGARTPAEIAISIAAELIEVRSGYGIREEKWP